MKVDIHQAGIAAMLASDDIRDALQSIAEKIQARAVELTVAEAVDTGLMAASWRVTTFRGPRGWVARTYNSARADGDGAHYAIFQEFGWRTRSGRHVPGKHILGRSIDAARI